MAVNRAGVASHLTAATPVRPDRQPALARGLAGLSALSPSPFAGLPATHFVRLAPFGQLGAAMREEQVERLPGAYLLTSLIFDGDPDRYLVTLGRRCPEQVAQVWGCCEGCPEPGDPIAFAAWLRRHELGALHSFATVPDATAPRIHRALALRQRLMRFAVANQDRPARELQQAYLEEFGDR